MELLKAFAMHSVDEADLHEIKKMISQYFARKAAMRAQQLINDRNLTPEEIEAIAYQHKRSATS